MTQTAVFDQAPNGSRIRKMICLANAAIFLIGSIFTANAAFAGAGVGSREFYMSHNSGFPITAVVEFDSVLYALNSVHGKYKILPIALSIDHGDVPVSLSRDDDVFTIFTNGRQVRAILDLAKADPEIWDTLDTKVRQALLYPAAIDPHGRQVIYVLAPESEIKAVPDSYSFFIKSLPHTLEIKRPPPMAR